MCSLTWLPASLRSQSNANVQCLLVNTLIGMLQSLYFTSLIRTCLIRVLLFVHMFFSFAALIQGHFLIFNVDDSHGYLTRGGGGGGASAAALLTVVCRWTGAWAPLCGHSATGLFRFFPWNILVSLTFKVVCS